MKTQKKQLPNEFTFICDKHSREQLEKLGVDFNDYTILCYKHYYTVVNKYVVNYSRDNPNNYPLINLSDYLDQEQLKLSGTTIASNTDTGDTFEIKTDGNRIPIEQKWQEKTRGGYEYHIYEEFEGKIFGRVKTDVGNWLPIHWYDKGNYSSIEKHSWDLLPYNPLLTTLQKELEELRLKEKEILEKIEGLKK